MKKEMLTLILMFALTGSLLAPSTGVISIISPEPIILPTSSQDWLEAIIYVESGVSGAEAYNPNEPLAVGKLQIWPIMVKDVNRIYCLINKINNIGYEKYSLDDRLDDKKAEEMFWVYQNYYNPEMNPEKMTRIWCGGPTGNQKTCTLGYYNLVKTRLYS